MENEKPQIIERYSEPNEMDFSPQYTICYTSETSVWVQIAQEDQSPFWIELHSIDEAIKFIHQKKNQ